MMFLMKDMIIGRKYGDLTVVEVLTRWKTEGGNKRMRLRTQCTCGNTYDVERTELRRTKNQMCPTCRSTGFSKHPLYLRWREAQRRCSDPDHQDYKWYGARGISMYPQWSQKLGDPQASRKAFEKFVEYVGTPPFEGATVDRIDNDKGYEPGNLRWATRKMQTRNRRRPLKQ